VCGLWVNLVGYDWPSERQRSSGSAPTSGVCMYIVGWLVGWLVGFMIVV
jgi:hypothetical protein